MAKAKRLERKRTIMIIFLAILALGALFAILLFILYTQLSRYQSYWTDNNQKDTPNAKLYVAFGDSTAQSIGATRPQNGYVGVIARELKKKGTTVRVINLSKSGGRVKDVLHTQLPAFEKQKLGAKDPIITMEIGANDMFGFEPAKFEREMDELMGKLPKQTVISDIPSFRGSRFSKLEPNIEQANEIMYRLADKHGFKLAELNKRLKARHDLRTFAVDLFHPSDYAYRVNWAPAFLERLQ
jgi:acyl-CoA thioesterase I